MPGAKLTLKTGVLRSKNGVSLPAVSDVVVVAPSVVVKPTVSLTGAQVLLCIMPVVMSVCMIAVSYICGYL